MDSRAFWAAALSVLILLALGNLALVGVMSGVLSRGSKTPEGRGPLHLHAPEGEGGASPYLATPTEVSRAMLRLAEVKPDELVADLGCGDARILVLAVEEFGARGLGVELDGQVFALARLRPLLEQQLRPGARVVTHDFAIAGWQASRQEKLARGDGTAHTIHLYRR